MIIERSVKKLMRNCSDCNSVFVHPVNTLCSECTKKRNEQFNKVKEYLRKHPRAQLAEVVSETGVSLERVREFTAEGRLKVVPVDMNIQCQICGSQITSGRICQKCQERFSQKTDRTEDKNDDKSGRMHILNSPRHKKQ